MAEAFFFGSRSKGRCANTSPSSSLHFCLVARDGHVARGAFVFDHRFGFWMIDAFAAHAGLPVRIARGIGHDAGAPVEADGDVFARRSGQAVVTCQAAVGSLELWFRCGLFCPSGLPARMESKSSASAKVNTEVRVRITSLRSGAHPASPTAGRRRVAPAARKCC